MGVPADLKYTSEHEWIRVDGDTATVGITAYAAEQLGDVVFVELPSVGTTVSAGAVVGEIESTKSVGELFRRSTVKSLTPTRLRSMTQRWSTKTPTALVG